MLNEYRDKIIEWIKNGRTASEISKEFGTSRTYPYNLAKRLNLPLKSNSNKRLSVVRPLLSYTPPLEKNWLGNEISGLRNRWHL